MSLDWIFNIQSILLDHYQFEDNFPTEYSLIKLQYVKTTRDNSYAMSIVNTNAKFAALAAGSGLPEESFREAKQAEYNQIYQDIYDKTDPEWLVHLEELTRDKPNPLTGKPLNPNFSVQDEISKLVVAAGFNQVRLTVSAFQQAIKSSNKPKAFLLGVAAIILIPTIAITQVVNKYVLKPLFTFLPIALVLSPVALLALLTAPLYAKDFVINLKERAKQARQEPTVQSEPEPSAATSNERRQAEEPPRHFPGLFPEAAAPSTTATQTPATTPSPGSLRDID